MNSKLLHIELITQLKSKQNSTNSTSVKSVQQCSTNPAVNVNVNDINKKENIVKEKPKKFLFAKELINLGGKENLVQDWLMVKGTRKRLMQESH